MPSPRADHRLLLLAVLLSFTSGAQPAPEPKTEEADQAYAARDFVKAASLYERAAREHPAVPRLWYQAGLSYHSQGRWAQAASAMDRALTAGLSQPGPLYNAACAHARAGHADTALGLLERAVAAGPAAAAGLAQDEDLASLRAAPRFLALNRQVEALLHPCRTDPRAHALDFWVGEWDVRVAGGPVVGHSSVQSILEGCVIFENWSAVGGGEGKSFNLFDRATGAWRQTWVSSQGRQVDFTGELKDGALVYQSAGKDPTGRPQVTRMTFSQLSDGRVHQLWEASSDSGKTWTVSFDGVYERKGADPVR